MELAAEREWSHQGNRPDPTARRTCILVNDIRQYFAQQGLVRWHDRGVLGGVCAGLGRRFGISPWIARLLFVLVLLVVPGSQILVYPILWILMPSDESVAVPAQPTTGPGAA
jgi:phage shock protein C